MTAAAAFPAAAQRLVRSAAGRRALCVGLFVGALFALGLLFGGRAQAADGIPEVPDEITSAVTPPQESRGVTSPQESQGVARAPEPVGTHGTVGRHGTVGTVGTPSTDSRPGGAVSPARSAKGSEVPPGAEELARTEPRTAVREVTRTVGGGAARAVAEPVAELTGRTARALPERRFPEEPVLPGVDVPGFDVPGFDVPGVDVPGVGLPQPGDGGSVGTPGPDGDRAVPQDRAPGDGTGADEADGAHEARSDAAHSSPVPSLAALHGHGGHDSAGRDARRAQPQLPSGAPQRPYGMATQSASDGGAQRHGELHAATAAGGPSFGLAPGAGAASAYYPTRDRHRDILEFPG